MHDFIDDDNHAEDTTKTDAKTATETGLKPQDKYCLDLYEASQYFGISVRRLRDIIQQQDYDFVLRNGVKILIKRKLFEEYIDAAEVI